MAWEKGILDIGHEAAEDLSLDQFRFVVLNSSNQVRRPDSASEVPYGILQDAPTSGHDAKVRVTGVSKLRAAEALAVNEFVSAEYEGAADAGKGKKAHTNWAYARAICVFAAGAEDDLASVLLLGPVPPFQGTLVKQTTVSSQIVTVGNATYTAANLIGGVVLRDCSGGNRSDVTPTAALIIAAMHDAGVGNSFEFIVINQSNAAETITITAGADVTLNGVMTIAQNYCKRFLCVVTSSTEVTIYTTGEAVQNAL